MTSDTDDGKAYRAALMDEKLKRAAKTAKSKRELAWIALRQTRNPRYVAVRYGFTVEQMSTALDELERRERENNTTPKPRAEHQTAARNRCGTFKSPNDLLQTPERRVRVPGEDDDLGE